MSEASQVSEREELKLSRTVGDAKDRFPADEPISAVALADAILDLYGHRSEYAGGKALTLVLDEDPATARKQPVGAWLQEIRSLYDASAPTDLHGRLVIIGLSLLDAGLLSQLDPIEYLNALEQEIREPLDEILSEKGRRLWHGRAPESLPNLSDSALENAADDQLGRAAYAEFLASRLNALEGKREAYILNIYGPWGSGKSSVLNFLRARLRERDWLVVDFNAWQHQRIGPPWWSLMDRVFRAGLAERRLDGRRYLDDEVFIAELWWRLTLGRWHLILAVLGLLALWLLVLLLSLVLGTRGDGQSSWESFVSFADGLGTLFALGGTFWLIAKALGQSLLPGSANAARNYMASAQDPMAEIKKHFGGIVRKIAGRGERRVVIFIDDLDRCQSDYAVELLEGVQTLFRQANVIFVIAADRCWLHGAYEQVYEKLKSAIRELGRPLGTQFLEKAFQLSAPLPGISEELKKAYWEHLLQLESPGESTDLNECRKSAQEQLVSVENEGQINQFVVEGKELPFGEQRVRREEAVKALAGQEVARGTEHALKPFAHLLEPNPRAMKRLVNAYTVHRALSILSQVDLERKPLALWTILSMRWPALAELLVEQPELIEKIGVERGERGDHSPAAPTSLAQVEDKEPGNHNDPLSGIPEGLRPLFNNDHVAAVVRENGMGVTLTTETVEQCAALYA